MDDLPALASAVFQSDHTSFPRLREVILTVRSRVIDESRLTPEQKDNGRKKSDTNKAENTSDPIHIRRLTGGQ